MQFLRRVADIGGRKSSFGIARIHYEVRAFAGAASDQLEQTHRLGFTLELRSPGAFDNQSPRPVAAAARTCRNTSRIVPRQARFQVEHTWYAHAQCHIGGCQREPKLIALTMFR